MTERSDLLEIFMTCAHSNGGRSTILCFGNQQRMFQCPMELETNCFALIPVTGGGGLAYSIGKEVELVDIRHCCIGWDIWDKLFSAHTGHQGGGS